MKNELWLVLQWSEKEKDEFPYEICGVFSTETKALEACRNEYYSISPITLDDQAPHETVPLETYYPFLNTETGKWETEKKVRPYVNSGEAKIGENN